MSATLFAAAAGIWAGVMTIAFVVVWVLWRSTARDLRETQEDIGRFLVFDTGATEDGEAWRHD